MKKENKKNKFLSFKEARKIAINLNLKSVAEWREYCAKNTLKDIPTNPNRAYKEWKSWQDWLGNKEQLNQRYLSYEEARKFIKKLNLNSVAEWRGYCAQCKKPSNIPSNPDVVYKKREKWLGWSDFLTHTKK